MKDRAWRIELSFMVPLLLVVAAAQSTGLKRPFLRHHEANGTEFSKHARNHLKFGLGVTKGLMLDVSGPRLDAYEDYRRHFYSHHPPLSALLLAGAFAWAGDEEAVFRLFLAGWSILALILFRRAAARLLPNPWDRTATLLFAALPSFVFYSVVTCLHVIALVGILCGLLGYLRWRDGGRPVDFALLVAGQAFACWSSWEGYYLAPVVLAAHLWDRRPRTAPVAALLGVNAALFGLYLLHLTWADPSGWAIRSFLSAGLSRSTAAGPPVVPYLAGEIRELVLMFTVPAVVLAAGGWISILRGKRTDGVILTTPLLGLHEVVFARLAANHEYYSYFLGVFFALAGANGLAKLVDAWRTPQRPRLGLDSRGSWWQ